jgi:hypothetical protein
MRGWTPSIMPRHDAHTHPDLVVAAAPLYPNGPGAKKEEGLTKAVVVVVTVHAVDKNRVFLIVPLPSLYHTLLYLGT